MSNYRVGIIIAAAWMGLCLATAAAGENADADLLSPVLKAKDADAAWAELERANVLVPGPAAWSTTPPTAAEKLKFYLPYIVALEDKEKDFYTRFSNDKRASQAKIIEFRLSIRLVSSGQTNQQPRFEAVGKSLLNDPAISEQDHFGILWMAAQNSAPDKAKPLLQEIARGAAPAQMKEAAASQLKKMETLGKPVEIQFTAVDGRAVDLTRLKGKVVLIDFWATWCPPCVGEMPAVKQAYDEFHPKGFEIVGISLDKDKDKLTQFVTTNRMEWPQYFDGQYWLNKYARQFGIDGIPAMWLIDKKGLLRDIDARQDLAGKVQKLLAE